MTFPPEIWNIGNVHGRLNASWKICSLAVNGQSFLVIDGYLLNLRKESVNQKLSIEILEVKITGFLQVFFSASHSSYLIPFLMEALERG